MTTYLFPGQGSQIKGMGGTLFDEFPEMTKQADDILGYSIKALCLDDEKRQLNQTKFTQPALYVVNAMSYQQKIKETGQNPDFLAGHSLGEYNALQAAGAFSFEDGLKLVQKRGELMSQAENGGMAAVMNLTDKEVKECIEQNGLNNIDIANNNAPTQIVISGPSEDVKQAQSHFDKAGGRFFPLNTSGAFHSSYMNEAKSIFEEYLQEFSFTDLQIPVISNVHARPYQPDQIKRCLSDQINHPVKWMQSMQYLLEQGEMEFEELGVGEVLTKLIREIQSHFIALKKDKKSKKSAADAKQAQTKKTKEKSVAKSQAADTLNEDDVKLIRKKEKEVLNKKIDDWNNNYPIGTQVIVAGYEDKLETRTKAMVLFGHRAAIYMQDYKGYFDLDEVTPLERSEQ
jgi:malonyl CoA-acyl carrier protein transacylase